MMGFASLQGQKQYAFLTLLQMAIHHRELQAQWTNRAFASKLRINKIFTSKNQLGLIQ